ncbi:hypothetical protein ED5_3050 [Enterobacter roggenkampii]|nr:hypothetical protein ED5_3050 [Enterobacter roggenkampii]
MALALTRPTKPAGPRKRSVAGQIKKALPGLFYILVFLTRSA